MVMDALVSSILTSIIGRSGLACPRLGTDSSRLNQEREWLLEFGNCFRRIAVVAVTCFIDTNVCKSTRTWIQVTNFCGLFFCRSHLTAKNVKITALYGI